MRKKTTIGAVLIVAAALVTVLVVIMVSRNAGQDQGTATGGAAPSMDSAPGIAEGDRNPDAGTIETDLSGRQVLVPMRRGGDVLSTSTDSGGTCNDLRSPAGMQIQRVNMYPVLFSTDSGPTTVVNSTPGGYADGPRGAILAGANSYMLMMSGGTPAKETLLNHMVVDEKARQMVEGLAEGFNNERNYLDATVAFRVRSCTDKAVAVDYALPQFGDESKPSREPKWRIISSLIIKDAGEWKLSMRNNTLNDRGLSEAREGYTAWDL